MVPLKLNSKPILAGIGGGILLLLVIVVYAVGGLGGGNVKKPDPVAIRTPWPSDKREVTVGEGGEYKSIVDALKAVRRRYEPITETDQMVIKIAAGTYRENISIDGTVVPSRRREKKADKPTEPDWPRGIKLLADGEVILDSTKQEGPGIRLRNLSRFVIEGISVKSNALPIAVEVSGDLSNSRLIGMKISGFSQAGVVCAGAHGISFGNEQLILEKLTFEPAADSNGAVGVRLTNLKDEDSSESIVRGCRFLGPLSAGVVVSGTGPYRIIISESVFSKTVDGIRFDGAVQWKDNAVLNNTFFNCTNGIVFTHIPADGSRGLSFRRNLFSKISGAEGVIQNGNDPARFMNALDGPAGD